MRPRAAARRVGARDEPADPGGRGEEAHGRARPRLRGSLRRRPRAAAAASRARRTAATSATATCPSRSGMRSRRCCARGRAVLELAAARAGAPGGDRVRPRLELVGERLELRRLAARAVRERLREQPVGEPRVARQQRAVEIRADRAPDAGSPRSRSRRRCRSRRRRGRAAPRRRRAACGRRGSRSPRASARTPGSSSHSSRTSPIIRRSPATVSSGSRPTPGMSSPWKPR